MTGRDGGGSHRSRNIKALAPDGRLVVIGLQGGRKAELDLSAMMAKRGHGSSSTTLRARPAAQKARICARVAESVWPLLASGELSPTVTTRFPLAEAADAHRRLESGDNLGKIVLVTAAA